MKTSSKNKIPFTISKFAPIEINNSNKNNNNKNIDKNLLHVNETSKTNSNSNSPRERNISISPKFAYNKFDSLKEKDNKSSSNKSLFCSGASNLSPLHFKNSHVNIFKENFKKPKKQSSFKKRIDNNGVLIDKINKCHHIAFNFILVDIVDVESYKELNKIEININENSEDDL